ncbi:MAG: class I SAM-dependent methyltransferase [Bacteroidia bacterium]
MKKTLKWRIAQKLERLWWQQYLKKQSPEEYRKWKTEYWQKFYGIVADTVDLKSNSTIADLGCGPAGIYTIFTKNKVTAADPLLDKYEQDLNVFNKADYPNVDFVTSSIENFEIKNPFDLVCCLNAINHVSDLRLSFLKLAEATKSNAYCLLSIDAHNHQFLKHLFRAIPGDALHPHQYDLKEYEHMMVDVGFEIVKTDLYKRHPIFNYYLLLAKKKE